MLFHVMATHTPEDCPGYNRELMPGVVAAVENAEAVAEELNVKIHFFVNGVPEHISFLLLEADNTAVIARFANSFPLRQDFKVTAVIHDRELAAMGRQMMEQG